MIAGGETINVEMFTPRTPSSRPSARGRKCWTPPTPTISCACVVEKGQHHLIALLDYFRQEDLAVWGTYTPSNPSLNDVFSGHYGQGIARLEALRCGHLFSYRLRCLLRDWQRRGRCVFPIALGTLFYVAFGQLMAWTIPALAGTGGGGGQRGVSAGRSEPRRALSSVGEGRMRR